MHIRYDWAWRLAHFDTLSLSHALTSYLSDDESVGNRMLANMQKSEISLSLLSTLYLVPFGVEKSVHVAIPMRGGISKCLPFHVVGLVVSHMNDKWKLLGP